MAQRCEPVTELAAEQAAALLAAGCSQLLRAPELTGLLAEQVVTGASLPAAVTLGKGLRAAAGGRHRHDTKSLAAAVGTAHATGDAQLDAVLRLRLGRAACVAGSPRSALAVLLPALDAQPPPAVSGALLACGASALSQMGRRDDLHDNLHTVLVNADRSCVLDDRSGTETVTLLRAEVLASAAETLRRVGDPVSAAGFAREGLHGPDLRDSGSGHAAGLRLELLLALLDRPSTDAELGDVVDAAVRALWQPVREPAAAPVAWMAHAVATRVPPDECPHPPAGLLAEAMHVAERHGVFDVLAATARELAALQEQAGAVGAARTVRAADFAAASHRRRVEAVREALARGCPEDERSAEQLSGDVLARAVDTGGFTPHEQPASRGIARGWPASIQGDGQAAADLVGEPDTARIENGAVPAEAAPLAAAPHEAQVDAGAPADAEVPAGPGAPADTEVPADAASGSSSNATDAEPDDEAAREAESAAVMYEYLRSAGGLSAPADTAPTAPMRLVRETGARGEPTTDDGRGDLPPAGLAHVAGLVVTEGGGGRRRAAENGTGGVDREPAAGSVGSAPEPDGTSDEPPATGDGEPEAVSAEAGVPDAVEPSAEASEPDAETVNTAASLPDVDPQPTRSWRLRSVDAASAADGAGLRAVPEPRAEPAVGHANAVVGASSMTGGIDPGRPDAPELTEATKNAHHMPTDAVATEPSATEPSGTEPAGAQPAVEAPTADEIATSRAEPPEDAPPVDERSGEEPPGDESPAEEPAELSVDTASEEPDDELGFADLLARAMDAYHRRSATDGVASQPRPASQDTAGDDPVGDGSAVDDTAVDDTAGDGSGSGDVAANGETPTRHHSSASASAGVTAPTGPSGATVVNGGEPPAAGNGTRHRAAAAAARPEPDAAPRKPRHRKPT